MVNDDISALAGIQEKLGVAARRKYGDLVYAAITGNPAINTITGNPAINKGQVRF